MKNEEFKNLSREVCRDENTFIPFDKCKKSEVKYCVCDENRSDTHWNHVPEADVLQKSFVNSLTKIYTNLFLSIKNTL